MCRIATLFLLVFMVCSFANASPLPIQGTKIPEYDYTQTRLMILYGEDDYVYLGSPFEHPVSNMGARVYEIVLLYVPHLQPIVMPPDQPTHVVDLMMKDNIGRWRVGQRLYVGNPWLSDGNSVALMMPADYQLLAELLTRRYEHGTRYDIDQAKTLKRVKKSLRPDDWLAQDMSVREAILRMPYQRKGYDPGAQVRRRWDDKPDSIGEQAVPDSDASASASETKRIPEVSAENMTPVITHVAPNSQIQEAEVKLPSPSRELKSDNNKIVVVGFLLLGFLSLSLVWRRKKNSV